MNSLQEILKEIREEEGNSFGYLEKRKPDKPEPKNIVNERQYWVQKTADLLNAPFKTILWKTINWPTHWISEMHNYCLKNGQPPARLWWGLIKKTNKKI